MSATTDFPFTVEDVEAAYREVGAKPVAGVLIGGSVDRPSCCGLGALCASKVGVRELRSRYLEFRSSIYHAEAILGLTHRQSLSFTAAFDDSEILDGDDPAAVAVGRACRQRLLLKTP